MSVKISPIKASDYLVTTPVAYVDVHNLLPLFNKGCFKLNMILTGETGIGKSSALARFAYLQKIPLITHWCSEDQRREHLIGHLTLEGNDTTYHYGPLPRAIEIANQTGRAILLLEELNGLTPQSQKLLNPLTDWHRNCVTDYSTVSLLPDAKLWIVGAMNNSGYGGVFALNEDLKSRFRIVPLGYPSAVNEKKMVQQVIPGVDETLLQKVLVLAELTRKGTSDYKLSPRDVVDILNDTTVVGLGEALRCQSGKFEGEDRSSFLSWVKSTFPADMLKVKV